jgi:hypothetical protein
MSDKELWDALSVLARRMGLLERGQRLEVVGDPRDEPVRDDALCLAFGKYGEVRLLCSFPAIHGGTHTWERAMVGKSPCAATNKLRAFEERQCELPTNHDGEHKATGVDGVRWTWSVAPRTDFATVELTTESPEIRCEAQEWGTNGHRAACVLVRGHEGAHRGVDALFVYLDPTEPRA